jgi:hypothetical protein
MIPVVGCAFVLPSPIYYPGVRVTQVACGSEHCLLMTEMGQVFSWGTGRYEDMSYRLLDQSKAMTVLLIVGSPLLYFSFGFFRLLMTSAVGRPVLCVSVGVSWVMVIWRVYRSLHDRWNHWQASM